MSKVSVSIIVPAHNEGKYIAKCLQAITENCIAYEGLTEIFVVDNNSSDDTFDEASKFDVNLLQTEVNSPAKVRNFGAKEASYEILAFIDGDCVVTKNWLELINKAYQEKIVGAYGGQHIAPKNDNWVVTCWNPSKLKPSYNTKAKLPGGNFSIRSVIFREIGGFNEGLISAEDDFLSKQVISLGYDCVLDSRNNIVHWGYPKSLLEVYKKQCWHGKTQLEAHGFFNDKLVIVTLLWLVSIVCFIVGLSIESDFVSFFGGLGLFLGPTSILINRLRYHDKITLFVLPCAYVISIAFIAGRSIGLLYEICGLISTNKCE